MRRIIGSREQFEVGQAPEILRALVATDDPRNLDTLTHLVRQLDAVRVRVAPSGDRAIERVAQSYASPRGCPDLIVLDSPVVDGVPIEAIVRVAYPGVLVLVCDSESLASEDQTHVEQRMRRALSAVRTGQPEFTEV